MRESQRFALSLRSQPGKTIGSELMIEGQPSGIEVDGCDLEAQFEIDLGSQKRYLLLVTDDCPYEECLHIYLVGEDGIVLERLEQGNIYTPGIVQNVQVISDRELRFDFRGPQRLVVNDRPRGIVRRRHVAVTTVDEEGKR